MVELGESWANQDSWSPRSCGGRELRGSFERLADSLDSLGLRAQGLLHKLREGPQKSQQQTLLVDHKNIRNR